MGKKINNMKIYIYILVSTLILLTIFFYVRKHNLNYDEEFVPSKEKAITLNFKKIGATAYLRAKVWGISGNHEEIVLSETKKTQQIKNMIMFFILLI